MLTPEQQTEVENFKKKTVETRRDLKELRKNLRVESDALHSIFKNYDKVETKGEATAKGVVVIQTSADKEAVAALQQHASEVSDFVTQGMVAMRAAMMKNMRGMMMGPSMHRGMAGHDGTAHSQAN